MKISLQEITKENYEDVCDLSVAENQRHLLAANIESIIESKFEDGLTARAIYTGENPVGFLMWYQKTKSEIKLDPHIRNIEICYHPENPLAKDFYSSFDFIETGLDDHGEDMLAIMKI